jgi:DNA-binding MarR family transcriptional regulator
MEKEQIKNSFLRVKEDIRSLDSELTSLKTEITEIKLLLRGFHEELSSQKLKELAEIPIMKYPTHSRSIPTQNAIPTHNPTVPQEIGGLLSPILGTSIGNEGVPTDRQTDRQTDQHMQNSSNDFSEASEILESLDKIKKEIRSKFKRLTAQEMTVFSTIYQLEEQNPELSNYKEIAKRLKLSESSIRDYTQRIISKGIPLKKAKINNKKIYLSVASELKKLASLPTILRLREL